MPIFIFNPVQIIMGHPLFTYIYSYFIFRFVKMHFTLLLSNIKSAFIIGIILAVFHLLGLLVGLGQNTLVTLYYTILYYFDIVANLLGMVSAYILIYGAYKRNSTALVVYTVSTIVMIIFLVVRTVFAILAVMDLTAYASNEKTAVSREQMGIVA